jgi:hypothetical protein
MPQNAIVLQLLTNILTLKHQTIISENKWVKTIYFGAKLCLLSHKLDQYEITNKYYMA